MFLIQERTREVLQTCALLALLDLIRPRAHTLVRAEGRDSDAGHVVRTAGEQVTNQSGQFHNLSVQGVPRVVLP